MSKSKGNTAQLQKRKKSDIIGGMERQMRLAEINDELEIARTGKKVFRKDRKNHNMGKIYKVDRTMLLQRKTRK